MSKKIYLVLQQGGARGELSVHAHDQISDARKDIKECHEGAYKTLGPVLLPKDLTRMLESNVAGAQEFYDVLEELLQQIERGWDNL